MKSGSKEPNNVTPIYLLLCPLTPVATNLSQQQYFMPSRETESGGLGPTLYCPWK